MNSYNNEVWHLLNAYSRTKHNSAVQAVTALAEGDKQVVRFIGTEYTERLRRSGSAGSLPSLEAGVSGASHDANDNFTVALLCLAADLLARQRHGVDQIRYEALRRSSPMGTTM